MGSGLAFGLQLVLLLSAMSSLVMSATATTNRGGGITASLIRRDQYHADGSELFTSREEVVRRDARMSMLRVKSLLERRQMAGIQASTDFETNLTDGTPAAYLMSITLGTPPQSFVAIADTGSDLTWLLCAPCYICTDKNTMCGTCPTERTFQPTKSSSYESLSCSSSTCRFLNGSGSLCPVSSANPAAGCEYGYEYGDGSTTTGTLHSDTISLDLSSGGTLKVPGYNFGCSNNAASNSSLLYSTDGLVGLGRGNISFPRQLGKYFGNIFGYCLVNRTNTNAVESSPLYFGSEAVPATVKNGPVIQYTPLIGLDASTTFYYVGCDGFTLGGKTIATIPASAFDIDATGNGGIFFDSGTTYTTLSDIILSPLRDAIVNEVTGYIPLGVEYYGFPLCYIASWSDWVKDYGTNVPILSFLFSNTTGYPLTVDTMWVSFGKDTVCLAIQSTSGDMNIFGSHQQVDVHVVYDLENEKIGFVESDCKATIVSTNNSPRRIASVGTSMLAGLLLLLVLFLSQ